MNMDINNKLIFFKKKTWKYVAGPCTIYKIVLKWIYKKKNLETLIIEIGRTQNELLMITYGA